MRACMRKSQTNCCLNDFYEPLARKVDDLLGYAMMKGMEFQASTALTANGDISPRLRNVSVNHSTRNRLLPCYSPVPPLAV